MRGAAVIVALAAIAGALPAPCFAAETQVFQGRLANGLHVVVIPDHRIPVVTHVIAYRAGAADDPPGASGLAHFVEHLMYKSTSRTPAGTFARSISRLGGRENAATSHDTTMYYQRVPRDALGAVMALEADRMANLNFDDNEVQRERDVIVEERRQRIDLSPVNLLNERVAAALHPSHRYGIPVLGWRHEMTRLTRAQAEAFYARHYRPDNAVLVVQGDTSFDEVMTLAGGSYGTAPPRPVLDRQPFAVDPEPIAARSIEFADSRVVQPSVLVSYFVPLSPGGAAHLVETIEILVRILAQGDNSRLWTRLVAMERLALLCEGGAQTARDGITVSVFATAPPTADLGPIQSAMRQAIADIVEHGVTQDEIERARSVIEAADLFAGDQQLASTLRYAEAIANGHTPADVAARSERLRAVTAADVQAAARTHLGRHASVTGLMVPAGRDGNMGAMGGGKRR